MTEIFDARGSLGSIRDFARSRRAGPYAVLGAVMLRAVASVGPHVTIPPIVGSAASLNMFGCFVGPSGSGKGTADALAREYLPGDIAEFPLGSGEGVAAVFAADDGPKRAIFGTSEIDSLRAQADRRGATIMAELRKMYMGEQLGQTNAAKETRREVSAHTYRACLSLGVQPERAGFLLDDAGGGTPQRMVWLPVADPDAPDTCPRRTEPLPISIPAHFIVGKEQSVPFPEITYQVIDNYRVRVLRGDPEVNPLDGHTLLTRAKVAVALMLIDSRQSVNEADWHIAGRVMQVSDSVRAKILSDSARDRREANRARAYAAAERDEVVSDKKVQRAKAGIVRRLQRAKGGVLRSDLRRSLKSDIRPDFDPAIGDLLAEGIVVECQSDRGIECQISTVHVDHGSTPQNRRSDNGDHGSTWTTSETSPSDGHVTPIGHSCQGDVNDVTGHDQRKRPDVTGQKTQSRQSSVNDVTSDVTAPERRPTTCDRCNISLPATATEPVCDDCTDPPRPPQPKPQPRPLHIAYDGRKPPQHRCIHCGQPLTYSGDIADGYHTADRKCIAAHKKQKGA